MNSHDQELTFVDHLERKPGVGEGSVEPEPEPEERTMTASKLTEGLGLTEAGIKVFGDINSTEQPADS
jgi:hypothetical protein